MAALPEDDQAEQAEAIVVTVGIPTYNRVESLRTAVAAVVAQTHRPLSLVICDNASDDGTEEFVRELVAGEPWVRSIRQAENRGPVPNFEAARSVATGKYFMWLADDDWIPPGYIDQCVAVLEAEPTVALVAGIDKYFKRGTMHHEGTRVNVLGDDPVRRVLDYFRQVSDNGVFYGLFRLDVLQRAGPMSPRMGADWLLLAEIAALGEIRTLSSTEIQRDLADGRGPKQIAEAGRLSKFEGRHPHTAIAGFVAWETLLGSQIYRALGLRRFVLAARATAIILLRWVVPHFFARVLFRLRLGGLARRVRSQQGRVRVGREVPSGGAPP